MSTISQLNQIDTISAGDTIPIYSSVNGDTVKMSLTQLVAYLLTQIGSASGFITQYASPNATGFSVSITSSYNVWLLLTPAAGYAAGTIVLPASTSVADQTIITVTCTQSVTTLTINGNGASVYGAPTSLTANQSFSIKFDGVNKNWYLIN